MAGEGAKSVARPPRGPGDSNYGIGLPWWSTVRRGVGNVGEEVKRRMWGGWANGSKDAMIFVKRHNCTLRNGTRVIVLSTTAP